MTNNKESFETELPPRPQEPHPSECCGRNCEHCVYVYYEKALKRWEKKVELIKNKLI